MTMELVVTDADSAGARRAASYQPLSMITFCVKRFGLSGELVFLINDPEFFLPVADAEVKGDDP
jgi:hypothetical protein